MTFLEINMKICLRIVKFYSLDAVIPVKVIYPKGKNSKEKTVTMHNLHRQCLKMSLCERKYYVIIINNINMSQPKRLV